MNDFELTMPNLYYSYHSLWLNRVSHVAIKFDSNVHVDLTFYYAPIFQCKNGIVGGAGSTYADGGGGGE